MSSVNNCDNASVQVAVRIRPLVEIELSKGCKNSLEVYNKLKQIQVKAAEKAFAFTFNYVFDSNSNQEEIYSSCVQKMLENLFKGYNVTVLAYGQTGSGKTFTMGTNYDDSDLVNLGVIPRALKDIFNYIRDCFTYDFNVSVSFIELYQETCYDLLSNKSREQSTIELREDGKSIIIPGLTEVCVSTSQEALDQLINGSKGRATASTNMNAQSSRSHAIFTVNIAMQHKENSHMNRTAKFHLVDLAGSERSKKTGATGQTFKEGVNINRGLLALGNVISALGDEKQQHNYIPYRDSNLTRLLKDSLGGNSITLMVACVSPADYNLEETLSTLRYADRAKKIKNKPVVNQDEKTAEINRLNKLIQYYQMELGGQGRSLISSTDMDQLRKENQELKTKNRDLSSQLYSTLNEKTMLLHQILMMQNGNETLNSKFTKLKSNCDLILSNLNNIESGNVESTKNIIQQLQEFKEQITDIECEKNKNEDELKSFEVISEKTLSSSSSSFTESEEINEKQSDHTTQQIAMNVELQEITKKLAMKEHLAAQIASNICHMVDYKAMEENEYKISALQKEKQDLLQQLKGFQSSGTTCKIAEQRRKRVQELESQIHDLQKKLQEQSKLIKMKEKDEQKIKQLHNEISSMKQVKVRLIKNMRQESEKFRTWKVQREREINKLKEQDRKRQNQLTKMETMYSRQQNVLKRKVEEAAAVNKRLKDALAVRKATQESKHVVKENRLGYWLKQEFDVHVSIVEAQIALNSLLEMREMLQKSLDKLIAINDADIGDENLAEIDRIKNEIEMNCAQISSLQQKLLDSDEENKSKTRWDQLQTMSDAKFCLKMLFTYIDEICKDKFAIHTKYQDLQATYNELQQKMQSKMSEIRNIDDQIATMEKEYEEKTAILLRQLRGVAVENKDEELRNRCSIQQEMMETLEKTNEMLVKQNKELQLRMQTIEDVALEKKTPNGIMRQLGKKAKKVLSATSIEGEKENYFEDSLEEYDNDDRDQDPDWRKTPLGKKVLRMKRETMINSINHGDVTRPVKRKSSGSCNCRRNCDNRICGCKKLGNYCTFSCKCLIENCVNRCEENGEVEKKSSNEGNSTFVKPEPVEPFKDFASKRVKLFDDGQDST